MARFNERPHSFTCYPHVKKKRMAVIYLPLAQACLLLCAV